VKAKDRATSKEQTVRITASSMLSKDDVDRMVREAREHADEDKERREQVETRNQADALAFQAERTLRDLGDKVSSEDKADVDAKVTAVREALKGNDIEAVKRTSSELAAAVQRVSTAAYQASAGGPGDGAGAAGGDGTEPGAGAGAAGGESAEHAESEEAVEGEFKEV